MTRQIQGLHQASQIPGWPPGIPHSRPRGAKALGSRFEAAVAKQLPGAKRGIWWAFQDVNGDGICQTDLILLESFGPLILECKHTWTVEGMIQLEKLYLPVVGKALGRPVVGVQVCKHLIPGVRNVASSLAEAINLARSAPATLHWRGVGPLGVY